MTNIIEFPFAGNEIRFPGGNLSFETTLIQNLTTLRVMFEIVTTRQESNYLGLEMANIALVNNHKLSLKIFDDTTIDVEVYTFRDGKWNKTGDLGIISNQEFNKKFNLIADALR